MGLHLFLLFTEIYAHRIISSEVDSKNSRISDSEGALELIITYYVNKGFIKEIRLYPNVSGTKEVTV